MGETGIASGVAALIPAYQAATSVGWVVRRIRGAVDGVIVVDDGSTDGTAQRALEEGAIVVRHPRNRGKGAALRTGFAACLDRGVSWVITLDADGQHDPCEASRFLEEAATGCWDLVAGSRMAAPGRMPGIRKATNRVTSAVVSWLARQPIPDSQCGFRAVSGQLLAGVPLRCSAYDLETEMLVRAARAGYRIGWVPVSSRYGDHCSHIRPVRDGARFLRLVARLAVGGTCSGRRRARGG